MNSYALAMKYSKRKQA